jgi:hypothetical protein
MDKQAEETRLAPFSSGELDVRIAGLHASCTRASLHHIYMTLPTTKLFIALFRLTGATHPVQSDMEFRFLGEIKQMYYDMWNSNCFAGTITYI